ncbi:MAG: sigma-70 family RNA polymerase sigma factor [Planctomycetota bacterium]|nr:sigma-70 family RNA polymerase sigma factor [Planctomycetota bacterium]
MHPRPDDAASQPFAGLRVLTPETLAVRAASGDAEGRACFARLVALYESRLFTFLVRRGESTQDAEELTQEAFLRAWERLRSYDPRWKFSTWLYTIALRQAISRRRRSAPRRLPETYDTPAPAPAPDTSEHRSMGAKLWALAAEHLTAEQHTALWLRYAENMDIPEIARVMRKSRVAVRVCLYRARQHLAGLTPEAPAPQAGTRRVRPPRKSGLHAIAQPGLVGGVA